MSQPPGIGLLNEGPLHAALKRWYTRPGDRCEVEVDGFVIDIVREGQLLEIQTRGVGAMKAKLARLLSSHHVRLIVPIAREKWILRASPDEPSRAVRRKSPKKGRVEDLFRELVAIPQLLSHPRLAVEAVVIREEESRRFVGKARWRKGGWTVEERRLLEVVEQLSFEQPSDWRALLPPTVEPFTTRDLATAIGVRRDLAQKMTYCFRHMGLLEPVGKRGRERLYAHCHR